MTGGNAKAQHWTEALDWADRKSPLSLFGVAEKLRKPEGNECRRDELQMNGMPIVRLLRIAGSNAKLCYQKKAMRLYRH